MVKKTYIKPEIREETSILTVRAFVTASTVAAQTSNTNQAVLESQTSVWVQDQAETSTSSSQASINFWASVLS